jgi:hypothetical protein
MLRLLVLMLALRQAVVSPALSVQVGAAGGSTVHGVMYFAQFAMPLVLIMY